MQPLVILQQLVDAALLAFNDNPVILSLQTAMVAAGVIAVYLLAHTVRDIILRTRSLPYQLACILLVTGLPVVGFFLYLLVRPARTVKERQVERMLKDVLAGERKIAHTVATQADHNFTVRQAHGHAEGSAAKKVADSVEKKKGNLLQVLKREKQHAATV